MLNKKQAPSQKKQAPMPPDFGNTTPTKETIPSSICPNSEGDVRHIQSNTSYATAQTTLHGNSDQGEVYNTQCRHQSGTEQRRQSFPRQSSSEIVQKVYPKTPEVRKSPSQTSARTSPNCSPVKTNSLCNINSKTAYQLLDKVRRNTQLSYEMSKVAVIVVVSDLQHLLPENVNHYFEALLQQLETPLTVSKMNIEETYDASRLKIIFTELTSCKEDSQQRNWMLYEDESVIVENITELTSILVLSLYIKFVDTY